MCRVSNVAIVVVCLMVCCCAVWAQGPVGTLDGTVLDQAGAVVPGATVVVVNTATGVEYKTTTTSAGAYTLPYLPAGTYNMRASAAGFRTSEANNIILRVAQTLTVNISLEIGQIAESVTVSDKPPLLEAGTAEIGRYINAQEYKTWPIFVDDGQRQIQEFIFSSLPGTTGNTFEGSINGGQEYSHEILIEGIPVGRNDLSGGNNNEFSPSVEAIGEFKLQTGAVGAQYNGGQTAIANYTIKSGTNDLHGTAFYYIQNEAFNAPDLATKIANAKKPLYRLNNEGYSLGGPVYIPKLYHGRNKTFWFTNYEKTHYADLRFGGFGTLPTTDFKSGDFSRLFDPNFTGNPQSGTQVGTDVLGRPIIFGQIYDPHSTRTVNGTAVRDPFPGNIIPQSDFDPVALNVINKAGIRDPTYNTMLRNIQTLGTCCPFFDLHIVGVKIDHNIGDKEHISGFYNQSYRLRNNGNSPRYLPVPGDPTSTWQNQYTPGNMVRLSLNSTLTPTILNRVAAGYNRFINDNGAALDTLGKDWAAKIGLQNLPGTMFPLFTFGGTAAQGGKTGRMGAGFDDKSSNGSFVYQDDLTWIRGKHSFRFGYDYTRYYYNDNGVSDAGSFSFNPQETDLPGNLDTTGHAFASFLLGAVHSAGHYVNVLSNAFRQPYHGLYAMDDWKITPKLTLNVGLRWQIIPPFYETTGRMSEIDLNAPNPGAGNRPGALVFAGPGHSRFNNTYWREFGPRFGLAYQVSNKMVVRTGYAMMNTPPIANNWSYSGFTYGWSAGVPVHSHSNPDGFVDDPAIYLSQPYPSLQGTLPNTDPTSANGNGGVVTTARDANRPGYVQNWNFTIQYQLPSETVLEVAYIGNKGTRLWGGTGVWSELDYLPAKLLSMGDTLNDPVSAHPQFNPYPGFDTTQPVSQAMRPYPQFYGVEEQFPYNQNSNYNSLQVTVTRHLSKDLGFLAAYTWSKAIGYVDQNGPASYYATVQDYFNRGLERSVTSFNLPQSFKLTWVYYLPIGKGKRFDLHWANYIIGGWQLAAIHNYFSGQSLQLYQSGLNTPPGFAPNIRPDVISSQETLGGVPGKLDYFNGSPYLNPGAFATSPLTANGTPLRVGTAPRFLPNVRGPAQLSETFRMNKRFPLWKQSESKFLQFGMTWNNPFNRIGPYINSLTVGDPDFGQVYAGGGGKTLQLDARIEF
ncbi:MAG TPA: carboxypeptidase regulatory-like domain-containing protein [Bryobacteraceae bacterium]|nr:carboxypeptidase regulatory-like domain-containing protein [Bryobacteraceae bacterium]